MEIHPELLATYKQKFEVVGATPSNEEASAALSGQIQLMSEAGEWPTTPGDQANYSVKAAREAITEWREWVMFSQTEEPEEDVPSDSP